MGSDMQVTINGSKYIIEEYDIGEWFWTSAESESSRYFPTASEAFQNAMDHVQYELDEAEDALADKLEAEIYGTYDQQVRRHHDWVIRH